MGKPSANKVTKTVKRASVNPFLTKLIRSFRRTIGTVFVFSFFLNLLALTVPVYLLQIYDKVLPGQNFDTLVFLTGIVLVAVIALGTLESVRRTLLVKLGVRFDNLVSEHLLSSSIHRSIKKSSTTVSVMRDLSGLRSFLSGSSMFPLLDAPWTPLFIFILYLLHPVLGLIALIGCLILFGLAVLNDYLTRDGVRENSIQNRDLLDTARTYVRNADVVQAMGMQPTVLKKWNADNAEALTANYRIGRINTRLLSVTKMIRLTLQVGIIFAAAWLILKDQLTPGATMASILLLRRAISPLEQSIRSWQSVLKARNSFRRISEYLDHSSSLEIDPQMPAPAGALVAEKTSFRRSGEKESVFSRVDLRVEPGKICALTGPTAAGKSTLIRVLAGIVPPTSGKVLMGGYELNQWAPEQLGPSIGYLPQDVSLFPGTVKDNISRLADRPINEVIDAAKLAGAHELIQKLPDGYDTEISEDGLNLSGGQRQRIGLARAVFGDPIVVLLDEPDANLDSAGRSALRKTLRKLKRRDIAILVITHHASVAKIADLTYILENRKVLLDVPRLKDKSSDKKPKLLTVSTAQRAFPVQNPDSRANDGHRLRMERKLRRIASVARRSNHE